jgi:hypothetical protein
MTLDDLLVKAGRELDRLGDAYPIEGRHADRPGRWLAAATVLALLGTATGLYAVTQSDGSASPSTARPAESPVSTSQPSEQSCEVPDAVPFAPTTLATTPPRRLSSAHVALWPVSGGMFEVWNGARTDLPTPDVGTARAITVLGRQAFIGEISDGFSVVFELGPTACERWAVVAHPGSTSADLEALATGLQLVE